MPSYLVTGDHEDGSCSYKGTVEADTADQAAEQFLATHPYVKSATAVGVDDPKDTGEAEAVVTDDEESPSPRRRRPR